MPPTLPVNIHKFNRFVPNYFRKYFNGEPFYADEIGYERSTLSSLGDVYRLKLDCRLRDLDPPVY